MYMYMVSYIHTCNVVCVIHAHTVLLTGDLTGLILLLYKVHVHVHVGGERKGLIESSRIRADDGNGVKSTEFGTNEVNKEEENNMVVVHSGPEKDEVNGCI